MKTMFTAKKSELLDADVFGILLTEELLKDSKHLEHHLEILPVKTRTFLTERLKLGQFKGGRGTTIVADSNTGQRIVVVGLGEQLEGTFRESLSDAGKTLYAAAEKVGAKSVAIALISGGATHSENETKALLEGLLHSGYQFNRYRKASSSYKGIQTLLLNGIPEIPKKELTALGVLRDATFLARDLINTAPNDCTPTFLLSTCKDIVKSFGGGLEVFDKAKLTKLGANTLLAVSKGSDEPPFLIKMVSAPKQSKRAPVVALVGKGVTFDSGGLSIKTSEGMMEMKADMSGAAAVIGAMQAILQLQPHLEVRAYIPTVENMINGQATRPGDVVTSLSGKTVEILNTDAEGRLILCDAITMAERDGADIIIDVATLTGACVVALGTRYAGLFTDDDDVADRILAAARQSRELFWRMPLAMEYNELLDSSVADMKNIGIRWGGAITAALFLKRFVTKARWAHLDIAGPAFDESGAGGIPKGGMGFAVRTLVRTVLGFVAE